MNTTSPADAAPAAADLDAFAAGIAAARGDDAQWLATVYRGDDLPQLTVRAVITGGLIGMLMSIGNLYMHLKLGISFGVAVTSCVLSYVFWNLLRTLTGGRLGQLSILENNCMQTTASAAGYSSATTLAVTFAALLLLDPEHGHQPWWVVTAFALGTSLTGVLLAIPIKRALINEEQLPFPTGTAAASTLISLYQRSAQAIRAVYALVIALIASCISAILTTAEDQFVALGRFFAWMRASLFNVNLAGQFPPRGFALLDGKPMAGFGFDPGLALIGFGMIIGPRVAFSMLASSLAVYLWLGPWLHGLDLAQAGVAGFVPSIPALGGGAVFSPVRWSQWGGAAILVVGSITTLALQWRTVVRAFRTLTRVRGKGSDGPTERAMARIEVPGSWMLIGMIPVGLLMVALQVVAFHVAWWAGVIAIAMTLAICLVISRAQGETDVNPSGPLGKVMQLVFALISPASMAGPQVAAMQNLFSAGIATNSAGVSAELLSDLKTGYLVGANPRKQFIAQLFGIGFGTLVSVPSWYLLVPNAAALEQFPAPASRVWVAAAKALLGGLASLPVTVLYAVLIGAAIGILLPLLERLAPRQARYLPSATGLGLGWVVPFSIPLSFALGASVAWFWARSRPEGHKHYCVPVASGLIAGESMTKAALAMLATALGLLAG